MQMSGVASLAKLECRSMIDGCESSILDSADTTVLPPGALKRMSVSLYGSMRV
jgi:hypothetical protein